MSGPAAGVEEVKRSVEQAGSRAAGHRGVQLVARAGMFSKSAVYFVLAALTFMSAAGAGGRATDSRGAISTIAHQPYGRALVAVLALGFLSLGAWFILEPIADRENRSRDWTGAVTRVGKACGGVTYLALAFWAFGVALGGRAGPSSSAMTRSYTARALDLPGGRLLVAVAAVVALVIAGNQLRNAWRTFRRPSPKLALAFVSRDLRRWAPRLALAGYGTQGAVIGLVGVFLLRAALDGDPRKAAGFDGALASLARQPYGMGLLALAALGLFAYGATAAIEARCQRL